MKPYIPRQTKLERERLELKLERSLMEKLEAYCRYLESDRDYVLSCVLQIVFRKDKGFAEWLRAQERLNADPASSQGPSRRAAL